MGYILPISHFEYNDYQKRVIKDKGDFHYIEKPYKITLDMQKQFNYDHSFTNEVIWESKQTSFKERQLSKSKQDQLIATITGKGSLFNESI